MSESKTYIPLHVSLDVDASSEEHNLNFTEVVGTFGTTDYNRLKNRPILEGMVIGGNKKFSDYGLKALTNSEIENLLK